MSRESELYKDKIEVSLDGRQIFYLFFGGAVIVGLVFVLGVMVGRRVEARGHVERAHVAATVDPLAALDRLEGGNGLSFQGTLRGADEPESDVEKKIDAMAQARAAAPGQGDKKRGAHAEARRVEAHAAPAAPDAAKPEDAKDKKATSHEHDEHPASKASADGHAEQGGAKKTEHAATDKGEPHAEVAQSSAKHEHDADSAKTSAKKPDTKKTDAKKAEADTAQAEKKSDKSDKKSDKPKYTLQLSSFQDRNEAESFLASVKSSGFQPYLTEADVDGKRYYRVRLGKYSTQDAANDAKAAFEKSLNKSASVMKL